MMNGRLANYTTTITLLLTFFLAACLGASNVLADEPQVLPSDPIGTTSMWDDDPSSAVSVDAQTNTYHFSSDIANDIRLTFEFPVEPHTFYGAFAWVKTNSLLNVEAEDAPMGAGIGAGPWNTSTTLLGTKDWTLLGVPFYSGEQTQMDIELFQGYWSNTCVGESWMTVPTVKALSAGEDPAHWRLLYVIARNVAAAGVDATTGEQLSCNVSLNDSEIALISNGIEQAAGELNAYGEGILTVEADIIVTDEPLTSFDYEPDYGFQIDAGHAGEYLDTCGIDIAEGGYDHVGLVCCQEGMPQNETFGLGGSTIAGKVRYSYVEFDSIDDIYSWARYAHQSAIFVHEFLHGIEHACSDDYGLDICPLHDAGLYGYTDEDEWADWYSDYIRCEVAADDHQFGGIPSGAWHIVPHEFS